jgi:hypothetical protein
MSDTATAAPEAPAATSIPAQPLPVPLAPVVAPAAAVPPAIAPPVVAPAAPIVAPPVAPAPVVTQSQDVEPEDGKEPKWLPAKLEKTRKALLRQLGAETEGDAKAAIEAYRAKLEAEKSELQRAQEKAAKVDPLERSNAELLTTVTAYAEAEMHGLTAAQRAAVEALAGESPTARINAIKALRPTWVAAAEAAQALAIAEAATQAARIAAAQAVAAPQVTTPAPLPPPASTAPSAPAPASGAPPEKTPYEIYKGLTESNPLRAARYRASNEASIAAAEKQAPRT